MVAFLNMDQAKSHSSTPPAAIALQYTVVFKLGLILERLWKVTKCLRQWQQWQGKDSSGKHISERTCCVLGRSSTLWTSLWSAPYSLPLQCCRLRRLHSPGCTWTGTWHDIWYDTRLSRVNDLKKGLTLNLTSGDPKSASRWEERLVPVCGMGHFLWLLFYFIWLILKGHVSLLKTLNRLKKKHI